MAVIVIAAGVVLAYLIIRFPTIALAVIALLLGAPLLLLGLVGVFRFAKGDASLPRHQACSYW